ncbi:S-adenosyl-L-methionine-dependent methyltransferase [Dichotomocladium elegans]|nr:S-adenosyl-L-methionine-dependent methyltransferase [Dichotomocladium elegans]
METQDFTDGSILVERQTSSTSEYRLEGGRLYHNRDDVACILPVDEAENDRAHLQHWLFKAWFNGNYCAPVKDELEKGTLVLDAGCGPGTWTLDMASTYPSSTFYGTDIIARFPEAVKPRNCNFLVHNLLDNGVLAKNHFGFIHQRFLLSTLLERDWEKVISEHVQTLAPGGWLECVEFSLHCSKNVGPKFQILINAFIAMCKERGLFWNVSDHLEELFRNAGLINISHEEPSTGVNDESQLGKLAREDFKEGFLAVRPAVANIIPELETEQSYKEFLEEVIRERAELKTTSTTYRIWGQKPI